MLNDLTKTTLNALISQIKSVESDLDTLHRNEAVSQSEFDVKHRHYTESLNEILEEFRLEIRRIAAQNTDKRVQESLKYYCKKARVMFNPGF